jgi:perosamine synthetase
VMCTHLETAYKEEYKGLSLPISEDLQKNSILIPLFIPMKQEEIEEVINSFKEAYSKLTGTTVI